MQNVVTRLGITLTTMAVLGVPPALAQQPPTPQEQQERAKEPVPITGELVALDANAKSFSVKTDAGTEMKFSYTEETVIVGGEKNASGLAAKSGSLVTVTYTFHGTANTATKIEIKPKQ